MMDPTTADLQEYHRVASCGDSLPPAFRPQWVELRLTDSCNLRCRMCSVRREPGTSAPVDAVLKALCSMRSNGIRTVTFSGGEPLLHPQFWEIAHAAASLGIRCEVVTNGTEVNDKIARLLMRHFSEVRVSVDGSSPAVNDPIRGQDTYRKIWSAIATLQKHRAAANRCRIATFTVIQDKNQGDVGALVQQLESRGIDSCDFGFIGPLERFTLLKSFLVDCLTGRNLALARILASNRCLSDAFSPEVFSLLTEEGEPQTMLRRFLDSGVITCYPVRRPINIGPDGMVYNCCEGYRDERLYMGNAFECDLDDIWDGNRARDLRRRLLTIGSNTCPGCHDLLRMARLSQQMRGESHLTALRERPAVLYLHPGLTVRDVERLVDFNKKIYKDTIQFVTGTKSAHAVAHLTKYARSAGFTHVREGILSEDDAAHEREIRQPPFGVP